MSIKNDEYFMGLAIGEAKKSVVEGGIPIGAVLVLNDEVIGRGHNLMVQNDSAISHGELIAIENAGKLDHCQYTNSTLYTTLSPCPMCSGAIVLYNIPRVVIGDNKTLLGAEDFLIANGVEVDVLNNLLAKELFDEFLKNSSEIWEKELERVNGDTTCKF